MPAPVAVASSCPFLCSSSSKSPAVTPCAVVPLVTASILFFVNTPVYAILIASFSTPFTFSSFASVALFNNPFSPDRACIVIPAKISNTTIVITNAISVIPFS